MQYDMHFQCVYCSLRQQVPMHGVFTLFSLSQYCCLHFWKNKVGSMLAQGFVRVKRSSKNHKMLLFVSWHNKYAIIEWPPFDAPTSTHGVLRELKWKIMLREEVGLELFSARVTLPLWSSQGVEPPPPIDHAAFPWFTQSLLSLRRYFSIAREIFYSQPERLFIMPLTTA